MLSLQGRHVNNWDKTIFRFAISFYYPQIIELNRWFMSSVGHCINILKNFTAKYKGDVVDGGEDVIGQRFALDLHAGVRAKIERSVAKSDVRANRDALKGLALGECARADRYTVGQGHALELGAHKGVCTNGAQLVKGGRLTQSGSCKCVVANLGQLTQGNALQLGTACERIGLQLGDAGQHDRGNVGVARECTRTNGGNGQVEREFALGRGSHQHKAVLLLVYKVRKVFTRHKAGICCIHGNGSQCRAAKGVLANDCNVLTKGDLGQLLCTLKRARGNHGSVQGDLGQRFATGEGVFTDLVDGCLDGQRAQGGVLRKGVHTDRLNALGERNGSQRAVACKGVVRNRYGIGQLDRAGQRTALECTFVDKLDVFQTHDGLERGTTVECAPVNAGQRRGEHHAFQRGQVCKGISRNGLHALGNDDLGNGVVTDEPSLRERGVFLGHKRGVFVHVFVVGVVFCAASLRT